MTKGYRLNPRGNHKINHALHVATVCQFRYDGEGRTYHDRNTAEGKSSKEAICALKRQISEASYSPCSAVLYPASRISAWDDQGMTSAAEWAWEDGWVLASIVVANASKHPDLAGVIGVADSINKAVLNRDELERAVNRLTGGGLLHPTEALVPSETAASLWERAQGDGGGWTSVKRLVGLLNRECHPLDPVTRWSLSNAEYVEAVGAYQDRFETSRRLRFEKERRRSD